MSQFYLICLICGTFASSIQQVTSASNSDLKFDFTGYTNVAKLMISSCSPGVHSQVNKVLGGSSTTDAIEIPTTNSKRPHVSCSSDSFMGTVVNFTLYKTDNDPATGEADRQRIEMKVFDKSPTNLKATFNTNYIYSWWFKLNPTLKADTGFFHIFQLKAVGNGVDSSPLATFTLTNKNGLHLRLRNDDHKTDTYYNMVSLTAVVGKWTQAFVQVNYKSGNTAGTSNSGSIQVRLKDQNGNSLFNKLIYHVMYWPQADFIRPKWGLYRKKSSAFQSADSELFQNVQIWKK